MAPNSLTMPMSKFTQPSTCAGARHLYSSAAIHSPTTGPIEPNLHARSCESLKECPAAVTVVPPSTKPIDGDRAVTTGGGSNKNCGFIANSTAVATTDTSSAYAPSNMLGVSQIINAEETCVAATVVVPNLQTGLSCSKCSPSMWTNVPPPMAPTLGAILVISIMSFNSSCTLSDAKTEYWKS